MLLSHLKEDLHKEVLLALFLIFLQSDQKVEILLWLVVVFQDKAVHCRDREKACKFAADKQGWTMTFEQCTEHWNAYLRENLETRGGDCD